MLLENPCTKEPSNGRRFFGHLRETNAKVWRVVAMMETSTIRILMMMKRMMMIVHLEVRRRWMRKCNPA